MRRPPEQYVHPADYGKLPNFPGYRDESGETRALRNGNMARLRSWLNRVSGDPRAVEPAGTDDETFFELLQEQDEKIAELVTRLEDQEDALAALRKQVEALSARPASGTTPEENLIQTLRLAKRLVEEGLL